MFLEVKGNQVSSSIFITIFHLLLRSLLMFVCNHSLSASTLLNPVKRQPILDGALCSGKMIGKGQADFDAFWHS